MKPKVVLIALGLVLAAAFAQQSHDSKPVTDAARIQELEKRVAELEALAGHMHDEDINLLLARTQDLHNRLQKLEDTRRAE